MNRYAYDENRFRRWLLIAGAVPAILALLAVGFITGRGTAPTSGSRTQVVNVQSGPGPTHIVNGVPVGYAHTQAGAVAAATNYLTVVEGSLITQPDKYLAAIDTLSAPEARTKQERDARTRMSGTQNASGLATYANQGRTIVNRVVPLAYHMDSDNGSNATVSIWAEGLLAVDGVLPAKETWTTSRVAVEWTGGDWRLIDIGGATADSFGPVPIAVQAPNVGTSLPPQLSEYRSYQPDVG